MRTFRVQQNLKLNWQRKKIPGSIEAKHVPQLFPNVSPAAGTPTFAKQTWGRIGFRSPTAKPAAFYCSQ